MLSLRESIVSSRECIVSGRESIVSERKSIVAGAELMLSGREGVLWRMDLIVGNPAMWQTRPPTQRSWGRGCVLVPEPGADA
jgi:hypothetical protein